MTDAAEGWAPNAIKRYRENQVSDMISYWRVWVSAFWPIRCVFDPSFSVLDASNFRYLHVFPGVLSHSLHGHRQLGLDRLPESIARRRDHVPGWYDCGCVILHNYTDNMGRNYMCFACKYGEFWLLVMSMARNSQLPHEIRIWKFQNQFSSIKTLNPMLNRLPYSHLAQNAKTIDTIVNTGGRDG